MKEPCPICRGVGWKPEDWSFEGTSWYEDDSLELPSDHRRWRRCECNNASPRLRYAPVFMRLLGRRLIEAVGDWEVRQIPLKRLASPDFPKPGPREVQLRYKKFFLLIFTPAVISEHQWELFPLEGTSRRFPSYQELRLFVEEHFALETPEPETFEVYQYL